jgi:hypothetical protein
MRIKSRFMTTIVALLGSATVFCACSYTILPQAVSLVKGGGAAPLSAVLVAVANAEKEQAIYTILTDRGVKSSFRADRRTWSRKLVEALAGELARRGAQVRTVAPLTISVALPEIRYLETRESFRLKVAVVLTTPGWTKNYEGSAGLSMDSVASVTAATDRAAGLALADAVKAMLDDPEFLAHLTGAT